MRRTPIAIVLILASLALIAAGCGDDDDETTTAATTTTEAVTGATGEDGGSAAAGDSTVTMTEYSFDPSDPTVAAGDSIEVVNDGEIPHNLTVEGTDLATSDLDGGDSEELTVDLDPGDYEIICSIADHAAQGMTGTLTVEE
ncbi:MAG TPA: plastocyanin/azurin family copper-binding protein [Solirubrobacterales bacterium]